MPQRSRLLQCFAEQFSRGARGERGDELDQRQQCSRGGAESRRRVTPNFCTRGRGAVGELQMLLICARETLFQSIYCCSCSSPAAPRPRVTTFSVVVRTEVTRPCDDRRTERTPPRPPRAPRETVPQIAVEAPSLCFSAALRETCSSTRDQIKNASPASGSTYAMLSRATIGPIRARSASGIGLRSAISTCACLSALSVGSSIGVSSSAIA